MSPSAGTLLDLHGSRIVFTPHLYYPDRAGVALPGEGDISADSIANSIANRRFSRSTRERDLILELGPEGASAPQEALNEKGVQVIRCERKRPPSKTAV